MGSPYPVLYNGLGVSQGIYDVSTTAILPVGTRASLTDGRVFYYSRSTSATPLAAGYLTSAEVASVDMDDLVTGTTVVGDTSISMTPVGTKTWALNELAEGYFCYATGTTGDGISYKIKSNPVTVATTEFTIELYDGLAIAGSADAKATVAKNPWMDPVVCPSSAEGMLTGVPQITVPDGSSNAQYYWNQTWGMAGVVAGDSTTIGEAVMADTTTAGETLVIATAAGPQAGVQHTLGVNASTTLTFLTIAP